MIMKREHLNFSTVDMFAFFFLLMFGRHRKQMDGVYFISFHLVQLMLMLMVDIYKFISV